MTDTKKYDICVIGGAGHVGLPLSMAFADRGKRVIIHDINTQAVEMVRNGKMPFMETGGDELLSKVINKTLFATDDPESITLSEYVVVIIGTPVDEHLNPQIRDFKASIEQMIPYLRNHHTVVFRSTIQPGVTRMIHNLLTKVYPEIGIAYCPERIAEGKALEELQSLPQIISSFTPAATAKVRKLFTLLTDEILEVTPLEAELAKLFTNTWRYIQFATANQFYMIAEENNVNFYNVYNAMTYHYPRAKNFPKPGFAAGPCLLKDTMQLSAFTGNKFFLGHSAMLVNEGLPNFILTQLKSRFPDLTTKTVGILGMAFKAENDDSRESLSYKLKWLCEVAAAKVLCSDPYIDVDYWVSPEVLIDRCDIVIIGAPHARYAKLDMRGKYLVDVWHLNAS